MKVKLKDLRTILHEEFMRGVPEFMIKQAVDDCVQDIRQHIKKHILLKAQNPTHAREMFTTAEATLKELSDELYDTAEEKLWLFLQQT